MGGIEYESAGNKYMNEDSAVKLTSRDPESNGIASGLSKIEYRIDGRELTEYVSEFDLVEGPREVAFTGTDNLGNNESTKTVVLHVDATAPESMIAVSGPELEVGATTYLNADSRIELSAQDPLSNDVASGVREVMASVKRYDSSGTVVTDTPFTMVLLTSFALTEGVREVYYYSRDNVLNEESMRKKVYNVDRDVTRGKPGFCGRESI